MNEIKPLPCPFCGKDGYEEMDLDWAAEPVCFVYCVDEKCPAHDVQCSIELWNNRVPRIPEGYVAPAHKFLMERCWYWVPVIDEESLPPDGWKGVVEAETKRGHIEYRHAEYKKPLFGGKPEWSAWTFREEGDWKPLRWLKKWNIPLSETAASAEWVLVPKEPTAAMLKAGEEAYESCRGYFDYIYKAMIETAQEKHDETHPA